MPYFTYLRRQYHKAPNRGSGVAPVHGTMTSIRIKISQPSVTTTISSPHLQGRRAQIQASGFRPQASGLRLQASRLRAQGSGLRAQGSGFRPQCRGLRMGLLMISLRQHLLYTFELAQEPSDALCNLRHDSIIGESQ